VIKTTTIALAVVALTFAAAASSANAESTRATYVAQAEPICQANTEANRTILAGVQRKVLNRKLRPAGQQVAKATRAFSATVDQLAAVPPPPADAATISSWLASLRANGSYLYRIGALLKKRRPYRAQEIQIQLSRNIIRTNNFIAGWGFNYCVLSTSNFIQ
jgi:hypothetical protein